MADVGDDHLRREQVLTFGRHHPPFQESDGPDGAAARLRDHAAELLADGKPPMDEARRAWSRWASEDRLDAAAGLALDDPAAASMVLHERVIDLTATFFDLRGQWTPPTKRRPERIADLDPGLHALLTAIYADGASFKDQLALARRMLPLMYDEPRT